jgi:signal transduction histidine kinase
VAWAGPVTSWRPVAWLRAHPFTADCLLAAAVLALILGTLPSLPTDEGSTRELNAGAWLLCIGGGLTVAFRRMEPIPAAAANLVALTVYYALNFPDGPLPFTMLILLYSVAVHCPRRASVPWLMVIAGALVLIFNVDATDDNVGTYASSLAILGATWLFGDNLQTRRKYVAELEDRALRLEQEREERARQAVADERARIARELHDVVAHHVSVMVLQAGGARRLLERDPGRSAEALETIEATGRDALSEMRRLLGVLRADDEATDLLVPQPGVAGLESLVANMREAGLDVDLRIDGEAPALQPGIELSVYRIVQEALTNAFKHAGPARAEVWVRYDDDEVLVGVSDDGRGAAAVRTSNGTGHGIVGMRERVALFDGELYTGPKAGGGFEVRARIPLQERSPGGPAPKAPGAGL